ncbi:FAD dependent oxidoreductase [Prosthecobacter fusiformis]|uniref:FAD dependent oxidoreductase n=1 Tax=Prosthecobacter fusiformis TaxID=48464 RepID=A0A4V3FE60_9BACT|nr:FAD-dependent oxidoreductase [Prosthecobacter fusiformis]TDU64590.1 FAD dependent oxidoreductase [Prosthecobacter fusiformis]
MKLITLLFAFLGSIATAADPVRSYDLVVIGGTPGGIACAVRGAREGLTVLLVNRHEHIGGIMSSGLGVWDSQWEGKRSPIYDETRAAFLEHYRTTYGEDSQQYRDALPGKTGHTNGRYEPHIAEQFFNGLVAREKNITVLKNFIPASVSVEGALVKSVTLKAVGSQDELTVQAQTFADCTYEGDLAALAKVPYRIAREARSEFNEPHAGLIFMRPVMEAPDAETARLSKLRDALNLRKFSGFQQILLPQSTGAADPAVQACNYRTMLTTDPANRVPIEKPANYDQYFLKSLEIFSGVESIPNGKFGWNRPQIVGRQTAYVDATWEERQRIMDEHWEATLGLLYFLQNDLTVPLLVRKAWLEYGLAKDEFADNGHRPYEMYVRELRRIKGRAIYTQHDATLPPGLDRAPAHADSVAMTEWYMDSHSCTPARIAGMLEEGKVMLHQETFPGQIPYRCLLPEQLDNLIVPICISATHVAWGTVRLEPVFMQLGESAGYAAALAAQGNTTLGALDPDLLVRKLATSHTTISFFNDVDITSDAPQVAASQYFGTKGFFAGYNARLEAPLSEAVKAVWQDAATKLQSGALDPIQLAKIIQVAEAQESPATSETRGAFLSALFAKLTHP